MNEACKTRYALTRASLIGVVLLSLSACANSPVKETPTDVDLQLVAMGVEEMAKPRPVAGRVQRAYEAEDGGALMDYTLNLEDAKYLDEQDKASISAFVSKSMALIAKARQPACPWWNLPCRNRQRRAAGAAAKPP